MACGLCGLNILPGSREGIGFPITLHRYGAKGKEEGLHVVSKL